jgi:hypothetical protein
MRGMATRKQIAAARRNIVRAQAANRARPAGRRRARPNPANRAPGTRGMSTREYGKPTTASARTANYAYPRGVGPDRNKRPSYPIDTMKHARNALSRAGQPGTAGSVSHVRAALRAKGGRFAALANRSHAGEGRGRRR